MENLKERIEKILQSLKEKGHTRSDILQKLGYSENYITQALSKGNKGSRKKQGIVLQEESPEKKGSLKSLLPLISLYAENVSLKEKIESLEADLEKFNSIIRKANPNTGSEPPK